LFALIEDMDIPILNGIAAEILFVCHAEPVEALLPYNPSTGSG